LSFGGASGVIERELAELKERSASMKAQWQSEKTQSKISD
jgi:hypothetical protein